MKPMIKRLRLLFLGMMIIIPFICCAQSASKFYNDGIALMNDGKKSSSISTLNSAKKCFESSKKIDKSSGNVKKCNTKIKECNYIITSIKFKPKPTIAQLTVDKTHLTFPSDGGKLSTKVETTPKNANWTVNYTDERANEWCELSKSLDGSELYVTCKPVGTMQRSTQINVIYESQTHLIDIVQQCNEVELHTDRNFINFKSKGGTIEFNVKCNSDTIYSDKWYSYNGFSNKKNFSIENSLQNWIVESFPEWCNVHIKKNLITVQANGYTKEDKKNPAYKNGRNGVIVLRSQNKTCTIKIEQTRVIF